MADKSDTPLNMELKLVRLDDYQKLERETLHLKSEIDTARGVLEEIRQQLGAEEGRAIHAVIKLKDVIRIQAAEIERLTRERDSAYNEGVATVISVCDGLGAEYDAKDAVLYDQGFFFGVRTIKLAAKSLKRDEP